MRYLSIFLLFIVANFSFAENILKVEDKNKYRIEIREFVASYAKQRSKDIISVLVAVRSFAFWRKIATV